MLETYARFVTRHARAVLAAVLAVTALAIATVVDFRALFDGRPAEAIRLVIDPAQDSMLPTHDEGRIFYDRIRRVFGNDEALLLVAVRDDGIWHTEFLDALARATERLERADGVRSVASLANAPNVRSSDGDLDVAPFYEEAPSDPAEIARIRSDLEENPILSGSLVSPDGRAAVVVVSLLDMSEVEFTSRAIDRTVLGIAHEEFGDATRVLLTGGLRVKAETSRLLASDLLLVLPISTLLLAGIAWLSFRTPRGTLLPMLSIGLALVWTLALAVVIDPNLNLVTITVPALLLVVGFAYTVHLVSAYYEAVAAHPGRQDATLHALRHVTLPTLLTGLTTAAGFLSLATNPIRAIQLFGLYCGIGVFCSMITTLTFGPAVLALLPDRPPRGGAGGAGSARVDGWLARIGRFDVERRRAVLAAGGVVALVALAGIPRIVISTNMVESFPEDSDVRRSIEAVNDLVGASDQVYVILEAPYKDAWKEPASLHTLEALQAWLDAQPEVGGSTSLADHVKLIHRGFRGNDPDAYAIPDTKRLVSQLLFFGASDDVKRVVDSQYQIASIAVRINVFDSGDVVDFADRVEARIAEIGGSITGRVTGNSVLMARTSDEIAFGQAISLSSAFVIIFAILALLFTSLKVGLLAMLPNVLPVLIYFGTLGWTGVSLNVTTGLVACLVLGIAVDDTIHFLARFGTLAREHADERTGVERALVEIGRPITYTTAALCAGFLTVSLSDLRQQADFGVLAAFTLAVAWLVDITFTPALAAGMRIVTLWDVLTLDLGERPQEAIPLFHGLSPAQARLTALMTELHRFPIGHRLFHQGDPGDDGLYVVVEGRLRSSVDRGGARVALNTHERGDVVGEVGLIKGRRSADVDCETDVRLIRLDEQGLARLRRRSPRIAAQVFRNLSEVLAGRLVKATERLR